MKLLSIITPTYNRAGFLPKCFQSLLRQSCNDFEWIIVDDGSTDNTEEVIHTFQSDRFPIYKIIKQNGGKHTALNAAHQWIHGDYILILDSDDYLTDTAVEEVLTAWKRYDGNPSVGILTFLKGTDKEHPVCLAEDYGKPVEIMRYKRKPVSGGDCCEVIRTDLYKLYPFPVFDGERFLSECALWNRVSFTHKCVYINSVIYICEYLEDGLTKAGRKLRIRCPLGGMFISNLRMDRSNLPGQRIKYAMLYDCYGFFAGLSIGKMMKESRAPFLSAVLIPAAYVLFFYWKKRYQN